MAISIIYILFGTNNTFSLRTWLAERETKLEHSEKFVDKFFINQTCLNLVVLLFFIPIIRHE